MSFNALPSAEEQEEVVDVLYDAMYGKSYRRALEGRACQALKVENEQLNQENELLNLDVERLVKKLEEAQAMASLETKRKSRATKRGLLILVNNLKHYLGDSWNTIFPTGMEAVEEFLKEIDNEYIMGRNTWSDYEKKVAENKPDDMF